MEVKDITISEDANEDLVQFVKHLEENLDPEDSFDCELWIETLQRRDVDTLPADGAASGEYHNDYPETQHGIHIHIEFTENIECPNHRLSELTDSFFESSEVTRNSKFDGSQGEYDEYIFYKGE